MLYGTFVKPDFYVSRWTFLTETFLFEKKPKRFLSFYQSLIFREKVVNFGKDSRQGWKNSLYVSRVTISAEKQFYSIQFTFSGFSGPRAEKKFHLRSQVFGKFGGVHSTHSDKHFLENSFYWEKLYLSIYFVHWNKICSKLLKKSLHGKNFYTDFNGSDWTLKSTFFLQKMCFC